MELWVLECFKEKLTIIVFSTSKQVFGQWRKRCCTSLKYSISTSQMIRVVETRLKKLLKKAEIVKIITPHSFRHIPTSLLIETGVSIKEIQQRLGHTDINKTMNIYAHITANMEEKSSQQFNKLMKDLLL